MKNEMMTIFSKATLKIKKYSPEILAVAGVAGVITGTVLACKATLKVDDILLEHQEKLDELEAGIEKVEELKEKTDGIDYTSEDQKRDALLIYLQTATEFVKVYWPAATVTVLGISCLLGSYGIVKKRNVALMAAYKLIDESFTNYRKRVVEQLGEEKDREFKFGEVEVEVESIETDKNGKEKKVTKKEKEYEDFSQYAKFFDETCPDWHKNADLNLAFLKGQQNYVNDLLNIRGHVFLNEVYDQLGLPRTTPGSIVGWVKENSTGDGYIDFGIFDGENELKRRFVNGYERSILLDFNVDGVIYDLI